MPSPTIRFDDLSSDYVLGDATGIAALEGRATSLGRYARVAPGEAEAVVRSAAPRLRRELREMLARLSPWSALPDSDDELVRMVLREVGSVAGRLVLVRRARAAMRFVPGGDRAPEPAPPPPEETPSWLELEVVDEAGEPIAATRFEVRFPSGRSSSGTTDANGYARVDATSERGTAQVSFPDLEAEHLVSRGA